MSHPDRPKVSHVVGDVVLYVTNRGGVIMLPTQGDRARFEGGAIKRLGELCLSLAAAQDSSQPPAPPAKRLDQFTKADVLRAVAGHPGRYGGPMYTPEEEAAAGRVMALLELKAVTVDDLVHAFDDSCAGCDQNLHILRAVLTQHTGQMIAPDAE